MSSGRKGYRSLNLILPLPPPKGGKKLWEALEGGKRPWEFLV